MNSYNQMQRWWTQSTLSGDLDPRLAEFLVAGGTLTSPSEAFAIYHDGYNARLSDSLRESYAAVEKILGSTEFNEVCHRYIAQTPSHSYNLAHYGADFSEHLLKREVTCSARWPFIADLARFEWLFRQVFEAAYVATTPQSAHNINAQSVFSFAPCLHLFQSENPVYSLWKNRHDPHPVTHSTDAQKEFLALWRAAGGKVQVLSLQDWQYYLFAQLMRGLTLNDALEALADHHPEVAPTELQDFFSLLKELPLQVV